MSRPTSPEIALRHIRDLCSADAAKHEPGMTYRVLRSSVLELACDGLEGVYEQPPAGLTPVQARADKLLRYARIFMQAIEVGDVSGINPDEFGSLRALLAELDPPKPPTLDETVEMLRRVKAVGSSLLGGALASDIEALLKRVPN